MLYALNSPELPAEVQQALRELISPSNLLIAAGVLAVWAGSHFFGAGEVFDIVLVGGTYLVLGAQAVQGLVELAEFGMEVVAARCDLELRRASLRLVRGIALLGVQAALAVLLRGARVVPRTPRKKSGAESSGRPERPPEGADPSTPKPNAPESNNPTPPSAVPLHRANAEALLRPNGRLIGEPGTSSSVRIMKGELSDAQQLYDKLSAGGTPMNTSYPGSMVRFPNGDRVGLRPVSTSGPPTIDVSMPGIGIREIKFIQP
ncbi:MAG TPA: hypothetical protein VEZ71_32205 [Archangium sp.]|nr:hypothetical protein [Archangium sp.]